MTTCRSSRHGWTGPSREGTAFIAPQPAGCPSTVGSSAIGKIYAFKKLCDEMGRRLIIRKCNAEMLKMLKMIKFDDLIPIEE